MEKCKDCSIEKSATVCSNCNKKSLIDSLFELEDYISSLDNYEDYVFYIQADYYNTAMAFLNKFDLPLDKVRSTTMLEENVLCVAVDKTKFDWGNFII